MSTESFKLDGTAKMIVNTFIAAIVTASFSGSIYLIGFTNGMDIRQNAVESRVSDHEKRIRALEKTDEKLEVISIRLKNIEDDITEIKRKD